MAAASAGAIQTGFLSGTIASSSSQLQKQQQPQQQQQQHHSEQPLQHNANLIGSSSFVGQQSNFVQRLNAGNYVNVKQHLLNNSPNVAPGWRRQLSEGEIVYFGPSGAALRKIEQIKDYLLRHGTCKCGLPCPLRPDYFFEFNPQPLQIPVENASNRSCLHHARFIEQHNLLSKTVAQPTNFKQCLSSGQKLDVNTVLSAGSISQVAGSSGQDSVYTDQSESPENQIENVTVSRTPPWRKNSILNQQQQQQQQTIVGQTVENANISNANNRVPPFPQQHLMPIQTQNQPPWQEETQKRRNNSKKRPNFKDDPTGYLNHQTAILHSSILSVHSPELQDSESNSSTSQNTYRQTAMNVNRSTFRSSNDTTNLINNQNNSSEIAVSDDLNQQKMSVMQQQQQNQNVYIQQFDRNAISENQIIIGSNGQPVQIVQQTTGAPVIYSNSSEFSSNVNSSRTQMAQSIAKVNEFPVENALKNSY